MIRTPLILAVLCIMSSFAMVPHHRFAREADTICDPETPCAWDVYKGPLKIVEMHVANNYCRCADNLVCSLDNDDFTATAYVYKCKAKGT